MERMWRKVNHSFGGNRSSKAHSHATDTNSSAGGFGDGQVVVAVACSSSATGRRLATSGQIPVPANLAVQTPAGGNAVPAVLDALAVNATGQFRKSLSQHVLQPRTASSERRRRRRRKSRPRRSGVSCVGGGGDNMS